MTAGRAPVSRPVVCVSSVRSGRSDQRLSRSMLEFFYENIGFEGITTRSAPASPRAPSRRHTQRAARFFSVASNNVTICTSCLTLSGETIDPVRIRFTDESDESCATTLRCWHRSVIADFVLAIRAVRGSKPRLLLLVLDLLRV